MGQSLVGFFLWDKPLWDNPLWDNLLWDNHHGRGGAERPLVALPG